MDLTRISRHADLAQFFDHAPVGFSLLDRDLRYIRVNPALAEINGFPVEAHIGKLQHDLIPEVDDAIETAQRRAIEQGVASTGHKVRVETPAHPGIMRQFEVDYFPVPDGKGGNNLGCCVHESPDSTKLVEALEQETQRSRSVTDNLNCFLAILAPDGTVRNVNAPALDVADLDMSEVEGKAFWDCYWWNYDEETGNLVRQVIEAAAAGMPQRLDLTPRIAKGGFICVDTQVSALTRSDRTIREIVVSGVDVTGQRQLERKREINSAELQHRMKNIFANIQSLARMLASHSADLDDFKVKFDDRIAALARTSDALMKNDWSDVAVRDLIAQELGPYADAGDGALDVTGPHCRVRSRDAAMIHLAIHELATNATKHGALSVEGGRIEITLDANAHGILSSLTWRERGGPPFKDTGGSGFGSILLERIVPNSVRIPATIARTEDGLTYRLG